MLHQTSCLLFLLIYINVPLEGSTPTPETITTGTTKAFTQRADEPEVIVTCSDTEKSPPFTSSVEICRRELEKETLTTLEGMAGMGWDNLQNIPMAQVFDLKFGKCSTTPDGGYLIPDQMQISPIRKIELNKMADYHEDFQTYIQSNAETINMDAGFHYAAFGMSGSFSTKNQETKSKFAAEKSSMLLTTLDYRAYTAIISPSDFHPDFMERLQEIAVALFNGLVHKVHYLAELMIRDFGTHVVTRAELGAKYQQEDYVDTTINDNNAISFSEIRAAASASFLSIFSAGGSYTSTSSSQATEHFQKSLKHSRIRTDGGPDVNHLLNADPNSKTLPLVDNLVVTDRSGVPLFSLITPQNLPTYDFATLSKISHAIRNATEKYYRVNKIEGCMDPKAANFDFRANVKATCVPSAYNQTFGGVYQYCKVLGKNSLDYYTTEFQPYNQQHLCDPFFQKNGATGDFKCDTIYEPVPLLQVNYPLPDISQTTCKKKCSGFWVWKKCHNECNTKVYKYEAAVETYYCGAKADVPIPAETGFLFGGLYAKGQTNVFTGSTGCPGNFQAHPIFKDSVICLSRNYVTDGPYEVQLGGFFGCKTPTNQKKCPSGFTQYLASAEQECDVFFCVRPNQLTTYVPVKVKRPPYSDMSALSDETLNVIYFYRNNTFWHKQNMTRIIEAAAGELKTKKLLIENPAFLGGFELSTDALDTFIESTYLAAYEKEEETV